MRVLYTEVECPFESSVLWELRGDFSVEKAVALEGGRVLTIEWEKLGKDDEGNAMLTRKVSCRFTEDQIPAALRSFVNQKDLCPDVESAWCRDLHDEAHPCVTTIAAAGNRLSLTSKAWLKPGEGGGCFLCTRVEISCPVFGVGGLVEKFVERDMRAAHLDYASRLIAHQQSLQKEPEPEPPAEAPSAEVKVLLLADSALPLKPAFRAQKARGPLRMMRWGPRARRKVGDKSDAEPDPPPKRWRLFGAWGCCGAAASEVLVDEVVCEDIID